MRYHLRKSFDRSAVSIGDICSQLSKSNVQVEFKSSKAKVKLTNQSQSQSQRMQSQSHSQRESQNQSQSVKVNGETKQTNNCERGSWFLRNRPAKKIYRVHQRPIGSHVPDIHTGTDRRTKSNNRPQTPRSTPKGLLFTTEKRPR